MNQSKQNRDRDSVNGSLEQGMTRDNSARKQAQQEREALLARLSEAQQLANLGIWEWDLVNDREFWSDELFHIFGRKPAKHAPHPDDYSAQYHPQDRDKVHDTLEQSLSKSFAETEFRLFRHDDKSERIVRMRCRVENGPNGLPARQIGTIIDITEQKQREQELNRLLSDLNKAQSVSHVGSWRWNITNNSLEWSDEMYNIFGINQDEFTGNLADIIARAIHPDDIKAVEKSNRSVIEKGQPIPLEYRIIRPEGEIRTVWAEAGQLVKDDNGKPASLTGVVMDITDRKLAEIQLSQSQQRYSSLIEDTPLLISRWLPDGTLTFVNRAYSEFFGKKPDALIGTNIFEAIPAEEIETVRQTISSVSPQDPVQTAENRVIRHDGQARWMRWTDRAFFDRNGNITHYQSFGTDIHDRRLAEEERDRLLVTLQEAQRIAHVGSWEWDIPNDIYYWSDELFRIYGRDPRQGVPAGQDHVDVVHPDDLALMRAAKKESLITGSYQCEYRLFRYDNGQERIVSAVGEVEFSKNEKPIRQRGTLRDVTDFRKAEAALKASEENNRRLVEHAGLGIGFYDLDGTILRMNRVACDLMQTTEDQLIGRGAVDVFGNEMGSKILDRIAHSVDHNSIDTYEDQTILPSGAKWFRSTYNGIKNDSGNIIGAQIISADISEIKTVEWELAKSETILENFSDGVIRTDPEGMITFWNQGAEKMFGYHHSEVLGKPITILWMEKDLPILENFIKRLRDGREVQDLEVTNITKDQRPLTNLLSLLPLKNDQGDVIELVGFSKDISALKQTRQALEKNERILSTLMGNLPGMAYRCLPDPDWTMRFISQGCAELTGYEPEELLNNARLSFGELIHPDDRAAVHQQIGQAIANAETFELTYRIHCKDGSEKWVWEKGELIVSDDNETQYLEGFISDITGRVTAEKSARDHADFLDTIMEQNPFSMFITDPSGIITRTNRSLREKLNLSDSQIVGKYNVLKDHNLVDQGVMPQVEAVFEKKEPCRFRILWKAQNTEHVDFSGGADLWIDAALFPIVDEHGSIRNVVCKWVDISEQVKATDALRESQRRYQSVVEDSPVLISRFKPDGTISFTNSAYSQFFIGKAEGMINKNIFDFILPSHHDAAREYLASFTPNDPVRLYDDQVKRHDGVERWLRWTDRALFDENGNISEYQAFGEDITEQKEYEIALQASEQRYQSVVEDAPLMIIRYLPDGTITFTNTQYNQFYTGKNEGLPWNNIFDRYPPDEQRRVKKDLESLSPENPIRNLDALCERFDGQQHWLRWKDVALFDYKGKLLGYQAFGEDIHEQYIAEQIQKESERDLNALMGNLPGIAYRADAHGRFIFQFLSQGCKELTGYEPREFLDDPDFMYEMIMVEEYTEPLIEKIRYAVEHKTAFEITYRIITKGGEEKWVWERGSVVLDEAGDPHHIEGFITDITSTIKLQEKLNKSEDLLNTSQRLSKAGGWEWDIASQTMFWTEETYRIHDFSPDEMKPGSAEHIDRSLQCYDPEGRPVIQAAFQRCLDEGQPYDLELPFTTANGRKRWVRTTGQPKWMDGKMVSVIGNIIDITDQKAAQQRILDKARFEQLLSHISASMLEVDIGQIDSRIEDALKQVGALLDLDRISVSTAIDQEMMSLTHTWSRKQVKGTKKVYKLDEYPWMFSTLRDGSIKAWSATDEIPPGLTDAEKQIFVNGGVQSFLGIPIHLHDQRMGGLAFTDTKQTDRFTPELIESLRLFAQIIGNAISLRDTRSKVVESEARFRAFMDNFPANAYIKNENLEYIFVNKVTSSAADLQPEDYIGRKTSDIFPPETAHALEVLDQSVLDQQIIIEKEDYFQTSAGKKRYLRDIKFPIQGFHGEKLVGGIGLDLTAQKAAEERVLEKARFEQLLAHISTTFLNMEPDHIDDGINNAIKEIGRFLDIDRVVVSRVEHGRITRLTHIWSEKELKGVRSSYDIKHYPWLFSTSLDGETVVWSVNDGLPGHLTKTERDFFRISAVRSLVSLPIQSVGATIGSIIFSDYEDAYKFTPELVESLHLFAQIISNAITLRDTQREIRESEARYRSVVEDAPVLINRYRPDGTINFANRAYCEFMGKDLSELIGRKFYEFMPADARPGAQKRLENISKDNPLFISESTVINGDGEERWVRWTVRALLNREGEIETIQSFGIDITDQRQAAERVAASERQFRSLFTEMANGFALFELVRDKKGMPVNIAFVEVNPAFEHITGLRQEDISGKSITNVLPDFDRGWLQDYIDIALYDRALHRKDFNQRLGIHTDIRAFSPRAGQVAVLLTDITEQETLQGQIEQERDRAQDYLDTVQSIMIALDNEGSLTLVNPKACELLGYTEQELLGKNWFDSCLPRENIAEIKDVFQKIVRGEMESVQYYENPVRTRLGQQPLIAWHNAVMKDRDGNFLGVLSAGEDITARKAAEKRFNTLFDISTKLIMESYDQDMLQGIADEVRKRIDAAQAVTIWLYNPGSHQLTIQAVAGFEDASMIGLTIAASEGVAGQVAISRQARLVHHAQRDQAFTTVGGFTPEMSRIQCLMCAPLVIKDRLLGVICVDNFDAPQALTAEDLSLVESIANQLAGVVENAILFEQLQQSQAELRSLSTRLLEVQEEERRLVALDLHDHFGQILTTFKLSLRPEAFIKHSEAEQRARLAEVTAIVDELIEAAEDLSLRLRPAILDDLGVATAFEWHIQRFSRQAHLPIHAQILLDKRKRFAGNIEITLFRVLEESLSNALRHGDPATIHVNLRADQEYIHLTVHDDGSGFSIEDLGNDDRSQTGLTGMQERVRLLNGEFNIVSVPQIGTKIEVKIPLIGEGKDINMENTP